MFINKEKLLNCLGVLFIIILLITVSLNQFVFAQEVQDETIIFNDTNSAVDTEPVVKPKPAVVKPKPKPKPKPPIEAAAPQNVPPQAAVPVEVTKPEPVIKNQLKLFDITEKDFISSRIPDYVLTEKVVVKAEITSSKNDSKKADIVEIEDNQKKKDTMLVKDKKKQDWLAKGLLIGIVVFIFVLYRLKTSKKRRRVFKITGKY